MRLQLPKQILPLLAITALTVVLYWPATSFDFSYDDAHRVRDNPLIQQQPINAQRVALLFSSPTMPGDLYRPLSEISYLVNATFSGTDPKGYHRLNIFLHIICVWLVFLVVNRLSENYSIASGAAAIFAVHPINVEAVASISGRPELLAAIFGLVSCTMFDSWLNSKKPTLGLSMLFLLLAALSKESGLCIAILAPLYGAFGSTLLDKTLRSRRFVVGCLFMALPSIAAITLRWVVLGDRFLAETATIYSPLNPIRHLPFLERLFPALTILGDYILAFLCPMSLSADYSLGQENFWNDLWNNFAFSWIALLGVLLLISLNRNRRFVLLGLWSLIAFSLTSNILFPIGTIRADRLAYLPGVGFWGFILSSIFHLQSSRVLKMLNIGLLGILFVLFLCVSDDRISIWQNNDTLYRATVRDNPMSPKAHFNLAFHLIRSKDHNFDETMDVLNQVYMLDASNRSVTLLASDLALRHGDLFRAETWLRRRLQQDPNNEEVKQTLQNIFIDRTRNRR